MSENRRKAPRTAFKPGVSGNPGGRPKDAHYVAAIRKAVPPESFAEVIVQLVKAGDARVICWLGERLYPKPLEITGKDGAPLIPARNPEPLIPPEPIAREIAKLLADHGALASMMPAPEEIQ